MQRWIAAGVVIAGFAVGIATGYKAATAEAVFNTGFLHPGHSNKEGFDRAVEDFTKIGGYESVAANCDGTSDPQKALNAEADLIGDLEEHKVSDAGLLNVARARLLVRATVAAEKAAGRASHTDEEPQRVGDLLRDAGWTNASEAHMRQIIQELDHDQCRQVVLGGAQ
jgi:hypothetical protein